MHSPGANSKFQLYGRTICEYQGEGLITLETGESYDCSFRAGQVSEGLILLRVTVLGKNMISGPLFKAFWNHIGLVRIEGNTTDGLRLVADENLLLMGSPSNGEAGEFIVKSARLSLEGPENHAQASRVILGFVNLDFVGNESIVSGGGASRSRLRIRLLDSEVVFDQLPNYKEVLATIKARQGADLTSTGEILLSERLNLRSALELADDLTMLFSFARARFINYIYYHVFDSHGQLIRSDHRSRILRSWPGRSLPPIDYRDPESTEEFIRIAFPTLQQLKAELGHTEEDPIVRKLVHGFLDAHTAGFYLTGALTCVSLLDFLRGHWAERKGEIFIVAEEYFKKKVERLVEPIQRVLKEVFPDLDEQKIQLMAKHVHGFHWWPFRDSYQKFFASDWIGISIGSSELGRFLDIRNNLVHRMTFLSEDKQDQWNEYLFLVDLLNKVFLSLLNYEGPYINWRTKQTEDFKSLKAS